MINLQKNGVKSTIDPAMKDLSNEDIDKVLRGEFSAVESYRQVIEKVNDDPKFIGLRKFKDDHQNAVQFWKSEAMLEGKVAKTTSGAWGKVVEAFVGTSKLMGNMTALKALKNGEEHGLKVYEEMLGSENLTQSQKQKIRNTFIPMQKEHIESIIAIEKRDD